MLISALICSVLMSCSVEEPTNTLNTSTTTKQLEYKSIDYEIIEIINNYRVSIGLNTLGLINKVSEEALSHNAYMVNQGKPSHDFFYLRSQNLKNSINAIKVSENVGFGFTNAQSIVNAWLNSEEHKQNIINPEFTNFGISTKQDENGKNYFTNIYVKL